MTVWLQLAAGTVVLLLPGALVARALRVDGLAEALTWSVALVAGALAVTFAVHGSLLLTLVLVLAAGAASLVAIRHRRGLEADWVYAPVALAGVGFGIALWSLEHVVRGDALFHLARMRKLDSFGDLSLRALDEFRDGGLHPGYAFPLWHAWLALVGKVTGLDPTQVVLHESSLLVPVALVLAYEVGREVFGSRALGVATMLAQVGTIALAAGSGGAYRTLELPGTTSRQLLVPAAVTLFFRFVREPSAARGATLGLAAMALAFVHPTYALFLLIVLVGYALARVFDVRVNAAALGAYAVPMALVFLWLRPIVNETLSHNPGANELEQSFAQYRSDLVVHSPSDYHLAAGVVSRTGAIAVAALLLAPLAAFAGRRRWSALVLGGTALVLLLELWSPAFTHFSDLVSISQSRRAAGFVPFAFAFAGGLAVLTRALRIAVLPLALAAGILLEREWPGDFELHLARGGPGVVAWIALVGCAIGIVVARVVPRRFERMDVLVALAATLFVAPVAVHGFADWHAEGTSDAYALTPGLVQFLRHHVPAGSVVFADLEASYRIGAYAPVYVANGPPAHVANTRANDPARRRADLVDFLRTGNLAIPKRYGARWLVLRAHQQPRFRGHLVYRDAQFRVYRL